MSNSFIISAQETKTRSCAETCTAVFAFLNVISASIGFLVCLNVLVLYCWEAWTGADLIDLFMWTMCISSNLLAAVSLMFAIILFIGINRKKPRYVLAYLLFGVIVLIALVCGFITLFYKLEDWNIERKIRVLISELYRPIIWALIGTCVVYGLLLTIICRTWCVMRTRRSEPRPREDKP